MIDVDVHEELLRRTADQILRINVESITGSGPAWTPAYTLTPSALGTWQWEEMRSTGLEGEWWRRFGDLRVDLIAGAGFGADNLGAVLAQRGWVLSDCLAG